METIKRILQEKISDRIAPGKAMLIFGAQRVGKTVMMPKAFQEAYPQAEFHVVNKENYLDFV